jgi:hypothetical protein
LLWQKQFMKKSIKTDLVALRQMLEQLQTEAKQLGLPMSRIASVGDVEKTIKMVEKKRV